MELLAFVLCLLGGSGIYLSSHRQGWRSSAWPRPARTAALALALAGLVAWITSESVGVGICAASCSLMLVWVVAPYLAWWRNRAAA